MDKFKSTPLGFLMSVIAKYEAHMQKNYDTYGDKEALEKAKAASEMMDNLKIELSKTESLKQEPSNEGVLMHVMENCEKEEQETILECVFQYLNLLDAALQNIDSKTAEGQEIVNEYYDVSRLGLLLNCYLGQFNNDDIFYGTLAEIADTIKTDISEPLVDRIEKADLDLSFKDFITGFHKELQGNERKIVYEEMIRTYSDSLLNKVLTQEVQEEDLSRLACAKQIQRIWEKLGE